MLYRLYYNNIADILCFLCDFKLDYHLNNPILRRHKISPYEMRSKSYNFDAWVYKPQATV